MFEKIADLRYTGPKNLYQKILVEVIEEVRLYTGD